jgi:hypothetical protein
MDAVDSQLSVGGNSCISGGKFFKKEMTKHSVVLSAVPDAFEKCIFFSSGDIQ